MKKPNMELRMYAKDKDIPLWAVAERLGMSDNNLYIKLRKDDPAFAERFRLAVDEIVADEQDREV
jgi:hypothetical protein